MNELCFRCKERLGVHPRWNGGTGTVTYCGACHQASLDHAAAYEPARDRTVAKWECPLRDWVVAMAGLPEWIASAAAFELATDQVVDHILREHPDEDLVIDVTPPSRVYDVIDEAVLA